MSEPLGRCECRDIDCAAADDAGEGKHSARDNQCTRDAVRLVTVEAGHDWKPSETPTRSWTLALCEPCTLHHERASHTERTTAKGGRE